MDIKKVHMSIYLYDDTHTASFNQTSIWLVNNIKMTCSCLPHSYRFLGLILEIFSRNVLHMSPAKYDNRQTNVSNTPFKWLVVLFNVLIPGKTYLTYITMWRMSLESSICCPLVFLLPPPPFSLQTKMFFGQWHTTWYIYNISNGYIWTRVIETWLFTPKMAYNNLQA